MPAVVFNLHHGTLRNSTVDFNIIILPVIIALLAWVAVAINPDWFWPILLADFWLLGYHHVIATFTRMERDPETGKLNYPFLWLVAPILIFALVAAMVVYWGIITVVSIYLYWQFWHYLRQSEGISKAYLGACKASEFAHHRIVRLLFYGVPLASFLTMLGRQHSTFINLPVYIPNIPSWIIAAVWLMMLAAAGYLMFELIKGRLANTKISMLYAGYAVSHLLIFVFAYGLTESLDHGWLALNIWHNLQYLVFVWLFNSNQQRRNRLQHRPILQYLSSPRRAWLYFLTTFTITTVVYTIVEKSAGLFPQDYITLAAVFVILYQTINFHHYVVDANIWKLRKPKIKQYVVNQ